MTRQPVFPGGLLGRFFVEELSSDGKIADKLNGILMSSHILPQAARSENRRLKFESYFPGG
jgi:hypothetical protein